MDDMLVSSYSNRALMETLTPTEYSKTKRLNLSTTIDSKVCTIVYGLKCWWSKTLHNAQYELYGWVDKKFEPLVIMTPLYRQGDDVITFAGWKNNKDALFLHLYWKDGEVKGRVTHFTNDEEDEDYRKEVYVHLCTK